MSAFGGGTGKILLNGVQCSGYETSLSNCSASLEHNCDHSEDAGVKCFDCKLCIELLSVLALSSHLSQI